jgi:CheY-like chemotaxis protein
VNLPESNGWKVLKLLKKDINLRHIPVHLISGEENRANALKYGARSFYLKPLSNRSLDELISGIQRYCEKKLKRVLLIEEDQQEKSKLVQLLKDDLIAVETVKTAKEASETFTNTGDFDCIILDFKTAENKEFLKLLNKPEHTDTSVILYSEEEVPKNELIYLKHLNYKWILKDASSQSQLLEEIFMALHVETQKVPQEARDIMNAARDVSDILDGQKVLVVDDDVRNLFALTAAFERSKLIVTTAESGREALEILKNDKGINIVLMDIMMPEMDGYETIQWIRKDANHQQLPIIAVTAKAMIGDRQKCIASGASDYITKPVKTDQLMSLMRVWLYK